MKKLFVLLGVLVVLGAVLVSLFVSSRNRGKLHNCRNNLRHLGTRAIANEQILDPEIRGRAFWDQIRKLDYQDIHGNWQRDFFPDPFLCPVYGKTVPDRDDPEAIDYLGPSYDPTLLVEKRPIGADRPGNHPDGGYVLLFDTSVKDRDVNVISLVGEPGEWLKD